MLEHDESETEPIGVERLRSDCIRIPVTTATLPPATRTNTYLLESNGRWLVVDVGGDGTQGSLSSLFSAIDAYCGGSIHGVLITHEHPDHHVGLSALAAHYPAASIYAHPHVISRIGEAHVSVDWIPAHDGDDWMDLQLMLTEGHARGHLSVVSRSYVVCGDMISGLGTIVVAPPDGDMVAYFDSLKRLADLGDRLCLPSHGGASLSIRDRAMAYLAHRQARERKVFAALDSTEPRSLDEITARAYTDVPASLHPVAAYSARAHLLKFQVEQRAQEEAGFWRRI